MARKTKRMESTTEEQWLDCNENNIDLTDEFLDYCRSVDRSPKTIIGYKSDLHIIMIFFKDNLKDKNFTDITKRDVIKFQSWCINQGMSPSRIRRLRSSCSSISNYIENMLDSEFKDFRNIINKIPSPSLSNVREKTIMSEEQIEDLLETLIENKDYQRACFIAILAGSGMRKSEIIQCKVNWYVGNPVIYEGMYVSPEIRTKGKGVQGKKLKKYTICSIVDKYLELWMEKRKELNIESDNLFVIKRSEKWECIKESTVDSWMIGFTNITKIDNYCHMYRHYSATWLKRHSVSIDQIRDFMGHNDSSTSEIYVDIGKEENLSGMLSFMNKKVDELLNDDDVVEEIIEEITQ